MKATVVRGSRAALVEGLVLTVLGSMSVPGFVFMVTVPATGMPRTPIMVRRVKCRALASASLGIKYPYQSNQKHVAARG